MTDYPTPTFRSITVLGTATFSTPATGDNSVNGATTAFVAATLAASPALGGTPTAPTPAYNDNSGTIATTAMVQSVLANAPSLNNGTVNGPAAGDNSAKIPNTNWVWTNVGTIAASLAFGAIGTYCAASGPANTAPGATVAGNLLVVNNANNNTTSTPFGSGTTWRFMGSSSGSGFGGAGQLWLRVS